MTGIKTLAVGTKWAAWYTEDPHGAVYAHTKDDAISELQRQYEGENEDEELRYWTEREAAAFNHD